MKLVGGLVILGVLAGCASIQNGTRALSGERQAFDGQYYSARVSEDEARPERFVVSVGNLDRGLAGAVEAGRYEATRYCIEVDGTSRVRWTVGPDTDPAQLRIADDTLVFQGECNP